MVGRSENLIYNYISIFVYFSFLKIGKKGKNALKVIIIRTTIRHAMKLETIQKTPRKVSFNICNYSNFKVNAYLDSF